jgi:uncharacterized membrane protein
MPPRFLHCAARRAKSTPNRCGRDDKGELSEMAEMNYEAEKRMDAVMGRLLQSGVMVAAALVLVGGVLYLARHATPTTDYRHFSGEPEAYRTLRGILREALALHGRGLIQLGLLVLIATPVARVVFSVFAFLRQRDWVYVAVTMIVLGLLCYSLFGEHG